MHGTIELNKLVGKDEFSFEENDYVDRSEFSNAEVLAALFNFAKTASGAISQYSTGTVMNFEMAEKHLAHSQKHYSSMQAALAQIRSPKIKDLYSNISPSKITHLLGKLLNVDLSQQSLYVADYDLHNGGRGSAAKAIETLREAKRFATSSTLGKVYLSSIETPDMINGLPVPISDDSRPLNLEEIAREPHQACYENGFGLH